MGMTSLISKIVPASALAPLCSFSSLELGLRLLNLLHLLFVLSPPWSWDLDFCYASGQTARCVCSDRWEDKYTCIYKYKWYIAPLCSFSSLELGLRLLNLLHLLFVLSPPWSWDLDFCYASGQTARCVCSDRWEDKYICIYKYKWYIKYINISGGFQGCHR